jgi:hypothetical protein
VDILKVLFSNVGLPLLRFVELLEGALFLFAAIACTFTLGKKFFNKFWICSLPLGKFANAITQVEIKFN